MGDDMVSLPKRGDRVRVTWAHQHSSLKVGSEVVLSSRGYSVDPTNELYRPTPPPDCVSFMYADADHRERGSHAVKVEILERATSAYEPTDDGDRAFLTEVAHAEFARGMRRAVEIALEVTRQFGRNDIGRALKDAAEQELKDGW